MVAQPAENKVTFNSGEVAPEIYKRTDIRQYYSAAKLLQRVEPVPQAGLRLMPGSLHIARVRPVIEQIGALPGTVQTTLAVAGIITTLDLGSAQPLAVVNFVLQATARIASAIRVETSTDGVTYTALASPFACDTTARSRSAARPPRSPATARYVRLALAVVPTAPTTFTVTALVGLRETASVQTQATLLNFTSKASLTYDVVLGSDVIDVFKEGVWVGAGNWGAGGGPFDLLGDFQRADVIFLNHEELQPVRLQRFADHDWARDNVPWGEIPDVDLGAQYTNIVLESWLFTVLGGAGATAGIVINVDGNETAVVNTPAMSGQSVSGADYIGFRDNLKASVESLPNINPGLVVQVLSSTNGGCSFRIQFAGEGNAGAQFTVVGRIPTTDSVAIKTSLEQRGSEGGEKLMSATRGWPTCGAFFAQRLLQAGFKARPDSLLASQAGEYFTVDTRIAASSGPVLFALDSDVAENIVHLARANHLVIFTDVANHFIADRALTRGQAPNVVTSSEIGAAAGVTVVENDGALLFVSPNRKLVYTLQYSDVAQKYVAEPMNLLASHLVRDVHRAALQKASSGTDAARYLLVRDDGLLVVALLIRGQDVNAMCRWPTDGSVKSVRVDGANRVRLLVERTVGGVAELHLETWDEAALFDGQVTLAGGASHVVSGLAMHEGRAVWADADGWIVGPFTVSGGQITLPETVPLPTTTVKVGRWTAPRALTLPVVRNVSDQAVLERPVRVHTVTVDVKDTTSLAVGANGEPPEDVPLLRAGDQNDVPQPPVTEPIAVEGLEGYTDEGIVEITQARPGKLQVLGVSPQVKR